MKYLVDTSAFVRILRRQVDARWDDAVARGLVAVCEPVVVEALTIADAKRYDQGRERDPGDIPMGAGAR